MALSRAQFDGGTTQRPSSGTTLRTGRGVLPARRPPANIRPAASSPATRIPTPKFIPGGADDRAQRRIPATQFISGGADDTAQRNSGTGSYSPGPTEALSTMGAPAPTPVSEEDYLAGDGSFLAQMAALKAALGNFEADSNNRKSRYGTDFDESMVNLGWMDKDNLDTVDVDEANSWNWNDTNYAAGRARQNTENDFASRGMMQSSLFGEATNNLERSLNDQRGGMVKAKTGFEQDLASQLGSYKAENKLGGSQARAEALQRRANGIAV